MVSRVRTVVAACAVGFAATGMSGPGSRSEAGSRPAGLVVLAEDSLAFGLFGQVHLYRPPGNAEPSTVILFVSGDGGWNLGVVEMARAFARQGALVVGVDIRHYLHALEGRPAACAYPAADFEGLSQFVQQRLGLARYHVPLLVGYSSGATLVYAVLAQAPPHTFVGAMSLGFCPALPLKHALCQGAGLRSGEVVQGERTLLPTAGRALSWVVLHGAQDQVCAPDTARVFVGQVEGAEFELLPHVGHGFGVQANWLPQMEAAAQRLSNASSGDEVATAPSVADLPLVEVHARGPARDLFAVVLSGDGGWAGLDRQVAAVLADSGIPVVGWNSLQYFWKPHTPEEVAADLSRVLKAYASQWHKQRVVLVGYSRGASVLPAVVNRLPPGSRAMVPLVALIAPEKEVSFVFHVTDLLLDARRQSDVPVIPEARQMDVQQTLCLYGTDESDTACPGLAGGRIVVEAMTGGHHLGGDYREIGARILRALP
jgi:type IV secretory pathway VirJ component